MRYVFVFGVSVWWFEFYQRMVCFCLCPRVLEFLFGFEFVENTLSVVEWWKYVVVFLRRV